MIYVTGDLHGDLNRFKEKPMKQLKPGDTLLVCGDFGFIWDGSKQEKAALKYLSKLKFNILFVEGLNENFDRLEEYPLEEYCGGMVHTIAPNIRHLCRGEVFTIENLTLFAFGGGDPVEDLEEMTQEKAHALRLPVLEQTDKALRHLALVGDQVDVILTHDAPAQIKQFMNLNEKDTALGFLHQFLQRLSELAQFQMWYFGRYHKDKAIPPRYRAMFKDVVPVELPSQKDSSKDKK